MTPAAAVAIFSGMSERAAGADTTTGLRRFLDADARRLGFDAVGVTVAAENALAAGRLDAFVANGFHGTMGWMGNTAQRRRSVAALWPAARSVIVVGMNYGPDEDPLANLARPSSGTISVYARHRDYHDVIKGRLKELAQRLLARAGGGGPAPHVLVATPPLMEKPRGAAAGLGGQGHPTNLVSRRFGSWLFLGSIATTIPFEADAEGRDLCGSCRRCQDACPTNAFPEPYRLDARRCISYLTIETQRPIPRELRAPMGNRIYGCDDCLAVCPWNKFASAAREAKLQARDELRSPALADLLELDDAGFRALFAGSPVKRIGRAKFVANCLIAAGNSADPALVEAVEARLADPAAPVRAMAVWALGRLSLQDALARRRRALEEEADETVSEEWHALGA